MVKDALLRDPGMRGATVLWTVVRPALALLREELPGEVGA